MRKAPARVHRELPFTLGLKAADLHPSLREQAGDEIILLQGIIDCLIETDDGFLLVDFKTDDIQKDELAHRIEEGGYAAQLSHYATAVERILQRPVREKYLCFLSLGKTVPCP